jgi:hypothetical protein
MISLSAYLKASLLVATVAISSLCLNASAQNTTANSRIAVVASETKTNIWISDFPKKTSVVVFDTDDNLLSIVSTNDFGAAYLSLPTGVKNTIIVKTLDGEISASNKVVVKNKEEQTAVSTAVKEVSKA